MSIEARSSLTEFAPGVYDRVAPVLRVLGHADRLRMVNLLMRQELPVAELARTLRLAPNAVSQHLNIMRAHGIVHPRRRGRQVFYRVVHPAALSLLRCMRQNAENL